MSIQHRDTAAVMATMQIYFDGLYDADSDVLTRAFHCDARYIEAHQDSYKHYSLAQYLAIIDKRIAPAQHQQVRCERIISVEFGNDDMVFVKASMRMLGRDYLDFLTLIRHEEHWKIITKVFCYTPLAEHTQLQTDTLQ